jgi:hypothetical protein
MNTGYLDTILEFLLTNIEHEAVSTTEQLEYIIKTIINSFVESNGCEIKNITELLENMKKQYQ